MAARRSLCVPLVLGIDQEFSYRVLFKPVVQDLINKGLQRKASLAGRRPQIDNSGKLAMYTLADENTFPTVLSSHTRSSSDSLVCLQVYYDPYYTPLGDLCQVDLFLEKPYTVENMAK
jgi:hypothetical protein